MKSSGTEELIRSWVHALTRDVSAFFELCAPDCRVWHSADAKWMTVQAAVAAVKARPGGMPPMDPPRTFMTERGFVVQMATTVQPLGKIHLTQLVTVKDDKVISIEEYIAPQMQIPG